jgi:hypothetical protein
MVWFPVIRTWEKWPDIVPGGERKPLETAGFVSLCVFSRSSLALSRLLPSLPRTRIKLASGGALESPIARQRVGSDVVEAFQK